MSANQSITKYFPNKKKGTGSGKKEKPQRDFSDCWAEGMLQCIDAKIMDYVKLEIEPKQAETKTYITKLCNNIKQLVAMISMLQERLVEVEEENKKRKEDHDDNKEKETMKQLTKATTENEMNLMKVTQEVKNLKVAQSEIKEKECNVEALKEKILGSETMTKIQRYSEDREDEYFKKTIKFSRLPYIDHKDKTPREAAVNILSMIEADTYLSQVDRVTFSNDLKRMRLTFTDRFEARMAVRGIVNCKNIYERHNGKVFPLSFVLMVPKRHQDQEKALYVEGMMRKKKKLIKHFALFMKDRGLAARFFKYDGTSEVIHARDLLNG